MKQVEINFQIERDEQKVPQKIYWKADEGPYDGFEETKGIFVAMWDDYHKSPMTLPLWTNFEMDDMNMFSVGIIDGVSRMVASSTGNAKLVKVMEDACREMVRIIEEERKLNAGK
jgi:gliding motility-associated protein GldC